MMLILKLFVFCITEMCIFIGTHVEQLFLRKELKMVEIIVLAVLALTTALSIDSVKDKSLDVMYEVEDSIFSVYGIKSRGTGWVALTKKGKKVIVTNAHVCGDDKFMYTTKNKKVYTLAVLATDPTHDICLIQAPMGADPLILADDVFANQKAYSVGFPLVDFMSSQNGLTKGYNSLSLEYRNISLKDCVGEKFKITELAYKDTKSGKDKKEKICIFTAEALVTTIVVDGGASGSPILNSSEEVVGMTMARVGNINWAYGVPLRNIKSFLNKH